MTRTTLARAIRRGHGSPAEGLARRMDRGLALLPMYDWPEVAGDWDSLWSCISALLRTRSLAAPEALTRGLPLMEGWLSPDLVVGQTCGLPYARHLRGRVHLLGTPDFGVPGCPPGWYASAIVVRADDPRDGIEGFAGATLAINGADSQSGAQAMMFHIRDLPGPHFGAIRVTGAHDLSAQAVAEGQANVAAIDFVTWRLVQAFRPFAAGLRVLALTEPNPGLPFIAATGSDPAVTGACRAGISAAPAEVRTALGLVGFVDTRPEDYGIIAERDAAARAVSAAYDL